jgi:hypothetical protein
MALWLKLIPKLQLSGSDHTSLDHSVLHTRKYLRGGGGGRGEDLLLAEPNLAYGSQDVGGAAATPPLTASCHGGANLSSVALSGGPSAAESTVVLPQRALLMLVSFGLVLLCANIWFWMCFVVRKRTVICCLTNEGPSREKALSEESDLAAIGIISCGSGGGGGGNGSRRSASRTGSFLRHHTTPSLGGNADSSVWYDNLDNGGGKTEPLLAQCGGGGGSRFGTVERGGGEVQHDGIAMISNGQVSRAASASAAAASSTPVGQARSDMQHEQSVCRANASRTLPRERRCGSLLDGGNASRHFFARTAESVAKAASQEELIGTSSCSSGGGSSAVGSADLELRTIGGAEPTTGCRPKLSTFCQSEAPTPGRHAGALAASAAPAPAASRAHVTLTSRGSERFLLPAESV